MYPPKTPLPSYFGYKLSKFLSVDTRTNTTEEVRRVKNFVCQLIRETIKIFTVSSKTEFETSPPQRQLIHDWFQTNGFDNCDKNWSGLLLQNSKDHPKFMKDTAGRNFTVGSLG